MHIDEVITNCGALILALREIKGPSNSKADREAFRECLLFLEQEQKHNDLARRTLGYVTENGTFHGMDRGAKRRLGVGGIRLDIKAPPGDEPNHQSSGKNAHQRMAQWQIQAGLGEICSDPQVRLKHLQEFDAKWKAEERPYREMIKQWQENLMTEQDPFMKWHLEKAIAKFETVLKKLRS